MISKRSDSPSDPISKENESSDSFDFLFSNWKKVASVFSAFLSFCGIFCILLVCFIVNDALSKTQSSISSNFDSALGIIRGVENSASSLSIQINKTNSTLTNLESSISPLSTGMNQASDSILLLSNSLRGLSLPGFSFSGSANLLQSSATSLKTSASSFNQTASALVDAKVGFSEFESSFSETVSSISTFKTSVLQTKSSVIGFFDSMKIANILFCLCFVVLFLAQIANSLIYLF